MHGHTSYPMKSAVSRIVHCTLEVAQLFVLAVFAAVITSQMTTASILAVPPTLSDLRGLRIGIQTNLLQSFLQSVQVCPQMFFFLIFLGSLLAVFGPGTFWIPSSFGQGEPIYMARGPGPRRSPPSRSSTPRSRTL